MNDLFDLHRTLAWSLIFSNAFVGIWAVAAQWVEPLRHKVLWWATGVAQLSAFAIAIVGVLIVNRYELELDQFHALYGFSTILAVGILYSYRDSPGIGGRIHLLYGLGGLFIMGLGIRAMYLQT